jgi:sulfite exporter TauE/SafE
MSLNVLLLSALWIGLIHTLIGPDHYLPFIVLGRAEGWSVRKAVGWTLVCGLGHVLSSVVLGAVGVALGWAVTSMEALEGLRGVIASWALVGFGLLYFLWGLWRGRRGHGHVHTHGDGSVHAHAHVHHDTSDTGAGHMASSHDEPRHLRAHRRSVWTLFIIFLLGPCEPLIPLLLVPAAQHSAWGVAAVAGVFGAVTLVTMVTVVVLGLAGLRTIRLSGLERYVHAAAGATLLVSGLLVKVFGI